MLYEHCIASHHISKRLASARYRPGCSSDLLLDQSCHLIRRDAPAAGNGNLLVDEQENVKRVQLATEYLDGSASLAGGRQANDKEMAQALETLNKGGDAQKEEKKVRSW